MTEEITIFIIDDDDEVREALQLLMESVGLPVEVFSSAAGYLEVFDQNRSGCIILDVRMKGMTGLELQEALQAYPLCPPIIMITGHADVPMAVAAVQAGVTDFIEKPFNDQVLLDSIHRAIETDAERRGKALQIVEIQAKMDKLTNREKEVMDMVVVGKRNKVIAYDLGISQSTVEAHRAKVMEKLEAKSLSDLMRMTLSLQLK